MRIYVASYFNTRDRIIPYVNKLREQGHVITSTWLEEELKPGKKAEDTATYLYSSNELLGFAVRDVEELKDTDAIVLDTFDVTPRGGREVEWGSFVFQVVPFGFIVGPKRNVFHELATKQFQTWEECLDFFKGVK